MFNKLLVIFRNSGYSNNFTIVDPVKVVVLVVFPKYIRGDFIWFQIIGVHYFAFNGDFRFCIDRRRDDLGRFRREAGSSDLPRHARIVFPGN